MKTIIKRKLAVHISEKKTFVTGKNGEIRNVEANGKNMKAHYFHERLGISFRIIGMLFEDERYEIYHARNKKYDRDLILHFLKKDGNGKRMFSVPAVNFERPASGAQVKPPKEVNLPWDNRSDRAKGH